VARCGLDVSRRRPAVNESSDFSVGDGPGLASGEMVGEDRNAPIIALSYFRRFLPGFLDMLGTTVAN
jgi:hypothetical protein